jgi:endonuclease/exonuclease/phosphatase family metal-dependent hydrolase
LVAVVAAVVLWPTIPSRADAPATSRHFTVLSYNVRGLPKGLTFPRQRFPTIGRLANRYDVVLAQEVFGGAGLLAREMKGKQAIPGMGLGGDPGRIVLKAVLLPFTFFIPDFWPPFGSGLYTFVDDRLLPDRGARSPSDVERQPYRECHGVFGAGTDCFARKGYLRVAVETAEGVTVDVYNTHLDAGGDAGSADTRWMQLRELACAIDASSSGRPAIVAGDLNIGYARSGDRHPIATFREHLGLADSGAGPEAPHWRERDYVLYRDGAAARLIVEKSGEEPEFIRDRHALSDHPALFVKFRVEPNPSGRRDTPAPERRFDCARKSEGEPS